MAKISLKISVALVTASAVAYLSQSTFPARSETTGNKIDLCHFKRTFTEDFNTLSVSASNNEKTRWSAHTPWNGDFGDARFIDPVDIFSDPEKNDPFSVKDGILTIRARKHSDGKWTSGLLSSADPTGAGFSQVYGYFEARMKLPPGPGVWPGFWLGSSAPKSDLSPALEVDPLEYYGQFPDGFHSGWHLWNKEDPKKDLGKEVVTKVPTGSLSSDFHTYGVEVSKEWLVFYFDRAEILRSPTPPEHKKPLMLLVNLALGSGWPIDKTPNPSVLLVDYVYAFARDEANATTKCKD
ncbi:MULTISPECIES: glycoside hydrolase family 16 protein [unclassified Methylobacterium]|uniref:glycoside hydrolase family 16 protein n=1 Tax=unclassified Methylobacterium TaxID=2615210 RepID=UPI00226AD54A|nr:MULTISPECIES: glycoside hydrolase family 16 protein [unclassified Methylobacterium]